MTRPPQGPGVQALVIDANQPPTGDNVKEAKLDLLARAYPQVVAGTPAELRLRRGHRHASTSPYSTTGPGGERLRAERRRHPRPPRIHARTRPRSSSPPTPLPGRLRGGRRRRGHRLADREPRVLRVAGLSRADKRVDAVRSHGPARASTDGARLAWSRARSRTRLRLQVTPRRAGRRAHLLRGRCEPAGHHGEGREGPARPRATDGPTARQGGHLPLLREAGRYKVTAIKLGFKPAMRAISVGRG